MATLLKDIRIVLLILISSAGYIIIGYFIQRDNFFVLFGTYSFLFAAYLYFLKKSTEINEIAFWITISIALRFLLLFSTPILSDDYVRFIWDGQLMAHGIDPFTDSPEGINCIAGTVVPLAEGLYNNLNSLQKSNPTCYPPFNQLFFYLPALLFPRSILGNLLIMRLFIIAAEIGTIYFGLKTLRVLKMADRKILIYALNPLIIIELTGNLHFEALMIFFLIAGIYFWASKKSVLSSAALALSVSVKFITLLIIPPIISKYNTNEKIKFLLLFFSALFILLIPLLISSGLGGFAGSVGLYFHTFEFNSGILSLLRQAAMMISGWDLVFLFGPLLALLTLVLLIALYITRNNEDPFIAIETMLFSLTVYYLLTSTVHPWYISTILIISLFTRFRYPVLWSYLVFLSYFTYRSEAFAESNVILITEYFLLYTFISFELFWKGRRENMSGLRTMHDKNINHGNVLSETRIAGSTENMTNRQKTGCQLNGK